MCLPVNFAKFLRTSFYIEHLGVTASGFLQFIFKNQLLQYSLNQLIYISYQPIKCNFGKRKVLSIIIFRRSCLLLTLFSSILDINSFLKTYDFDFELFKKGKYCVVYRLESSGLKVTN